MAVSVKWFPTLVKRTKSKQPLTEVAWRPGLTPREIFIAEGFNETDLEHVVVVINGEQSEAGVELADRDNLEYLVSLQGG